MRRQMILRQPLVSIFQGEADGDAFGPQFIKQISKITKTMLLTFLQHRFSSRAKPIIGDVRRERSPEHEIDSLNPTS